MRNLGARIDASLRKLDIMTIKDGIGIVLDTQITSLWNTGQHRPHIREFGLTINRKQTTQIDWHSNLTKQTAESLCQIEVMADPICEE